MVAGAPPTVARGVVAGATPTVALGVVAGAPPIVARGVGREGRMTGQAWILYVYHN